MKNTFFKLLFFILVVLFIPYFITVFLNSVNSNEETTIPYDGRIVIMNDSNTTQTMDYSVYLHGMVARMMISFDAQAMQYDELIKLCCVISNTLLNQRYQEKTVLSDEFLGEYYISEDDLKIYWGDNYTEYHNKIVQSIEQTKNQVITYGGSIITPFYHLISSGMTRPHENSDAYPYIKSVNTNKDLEENSFLAVKRFTTQEFINIINNYYGEIIIGDLQTDLKEKIQITGRNLAGYVTFLNLCDKTLSGDEFAQIFSLNSPSFTITYQDDSIKIITKGIGHGYGISLAFALRKAMNGETYDSIIKYFYEKVEIKNMTDIE